MFKPLLQKLGEGLKAQNAKYKMQTLPFALCILFFAICYTSAQAQVSYALSPNNITPKVGDTVRLNVVVNNWTNIISFQYSLDWDATLLKYVSLSNRVLPDSNNLQANASTNSCLIVAYNSTGGAVRSVPNGQSIYTLTFVVLSTSNNYWLRFGNTCQTAETVGSGGASLTMTFTNLGNPPGVASIPLTVTTIGSTVISGSPVVVPVTTASFSKITAAAWSNTWNATVLRLDSVSKFNATLPLTNANFDNTQTASGTLGFNWSASPANKTLVDNDTLYKLYFTAIGSNGTSTLVQTTATPSGVMRSSGGANTNIAVNAQNGTVKVALPSSTALTFLASTASGVVGDLVCVNVYTKNFTNIVGTQWSMHWDSTKVKLISAAQKNINLGSDSLAPGTFVSPGNIFTTKAATTGTLAYFWQDPGAVARTLTGDSTLIFNVCFQILTGPNSPFTFNAVPLKVLILTGDIPSQKPIPVLIAGSIIVSNALQPITTVKTTKNITCAGGNDGAISQTVSGATGTYTYGWSSSNTGFAATTKDLTSIKAGTYYVTITSGALIKKDTFVLSEAPLIVISNTVGEVKCFGQNIGNINATVQGGVAPYKFAWSSGETTQNIASKAGGNYVLTVTDASGCTQNSGNINIPSPTAVLNIVGTGTVSNTSCKSGSDGKIAITPQGGTQAYAFNWSGPNGYSNTSQNLSSLLAGNYALTIIDTKGCTFNSTFTITEPDSIKVASVSTTNTNCGNKSGSVTVLGITGGTGAYTYTWTGANGFTSASTSSANLANVAAGSYSLVVTDSKNCSSATITAVVGNVASNLNATTTAITPLCNGQNTGSITATPSGGTAPYKYLWSGPNSFSDNVQQTKNLKAGTYSLLVTDNIGCTYSVNSIIVSQPDALTITSPKVNAIICKIANAKGSIDLTGTVTGGTPTINYAWSNGVSTALNGNLSKGDYTVTVSDANQCTLVKTYTITEPTDSFKITAAAATDVTCFGSKNGSVSITLIGGTAPLSFSWSGAAGFNSSAQNLPATLDAGTYFLNIIDANNCKVNASYIINQPSDIIINPISIQSSVNNCDGKITLSPTGGTLNYTYSWSGGGVAATSQNQNALCRGTYNVTVTDSRNCSKSTSIFVEGSSTGITVSDVAIVPSGCPGQNKGIINIKVSGGTPSYSFEWYNRASPTSIIDRSQNISSKSTGVYFVRIIDNIGQAFTSPDYTIQGSATNIAIALKNKMNETCAGNDGSIQLDVSGGTAPYTYSWNTGETSRDRTSLKANTYSVIVKDNNLCFQSSDNYIIPKDPCPLSVLQSSNAPTCSDSKNGSITINITNGEPGYSIRYTNSSTLDSTIKVDNTPSHSANVNIAGLVADTYNFTITDVKGQVSSFKVVLAPQSPIVITRVITDDNGNGSGSIVLNVSGGTQPYTYKWNTGETQRDLFNLLAGKIESVNVLDAKGCSIQGPLDTIQLRYTTMTINANITAGICPSDSATNVIAITVVGGAAPYSYVWKNAAGVIISTSQNLTNIVAGTYTVFVTDNAKPTPQTVSKSYTFTAQSDLKIATVTPVDATTSTQGSITVVAVGGKPTYQYKLSNGVTSASGVFGGLAAGTYSVTVTDLQGCSVSQGGIIIKLSTCATVTKNTNPAYNGYDINCNSFTNGSATITNISSDYAEPITYTWSNTTNPNEIGKTAFSLSAGKQTVILKDKAGKTCALNFEITAPDPLVIKVITTDNITLNAVITGGVPPYKYVWNTADTTPSITNAKSNTTYQVFTEDKNRCTTNVSYKTNGPKGVNCLVGSMVITPDGDGINDNFLFDPCDNSTSRLEIYSRWGQLLYSKDNYDGKAGDWKGRDRDGDNGNALPDGVYLYIIKGTAANGALSTQKGTVTIIRS